VRVLVSNSILTLRSSFSRAAAASTECMSWLLAGMKLLAPEASAVQELAAIFVPFVPDPFWAKGKRGSTVC
jgi:hypothetical protein